MTSEYNNNIDFNEVDSFRDHIATVSETGKRIWLFPREIKGYFTKLRRWIGWTLIGLWIVGPWLTWNNQPLMLFNVFDRHFIILGQHFFPQDLMYFGILLLTSFIFIAVFTVTFGRVWCGWACPQTLFMEQIFRRIEYWIEGSAQQQKKLSQQPWDAEKVTKTVSKHGLFLLISASIGVLVLLYVFGKESVFNWFGNGLMSNGNYLAFWLGFSFIFYGVFSWAREQVCIAICPYGRLQSVLLNNQSLMVIYNTLRGEPRKERGKSNEAHTTGGDCIDCNLCVQVCPTGIDIRNGSQLECINCTACIDACDAVMAKIGKASGLVTLSSHSQMTPISQPWKPNKRVWMACVIMAFLLIADGFILISRSPMNITLLRVPGQLYQVGLKDTVTNLYNLQMTNKTEDTIKLMPQIEGGAIKLVAGNYTVPPRGQTDLTLFIALPKSQLKSRKNEIDVILKSTKGLVFTKKTTFLAP